LKLGQYRIFRGFLPLCVLARQFCFGFAHKAAGLESGKGKMGSAPFRFGWSYERGFGQGSFHATIISRKDRCAQTQTQAKLWREYFPL